jgi:hypothetical protein
MQPSEAGHWYDALTGEPRYTVIGANGQERASTLRDARKHGWVPSVTTILQAAAKPGLERWKAEQVLMAGLTLPRLPDEPEKAWTARVWEDSKQQAQKAAERGTIIHAAIEKWFSTGEVDADYMRWIGAVSDLMDAFGSQTWLPEKSFASPLGYGGKVDLHSANVVLDFKTKDGTLAKVECYDEHYMQVAAYAQGLGIGDAACGIVFVRRDEPEARLVMHAAEDTRRGWAMFQALLAYWKAANRL